MISYTLYDVGDTVGVTKRTYIFQATGNCTFLPEYACKWQNSL